MSWLLREKQEYFFCAMQTVVSAGLYFLRYQSCLLRAAAQNKVNSCLLLR